MSDVNAMVTRARQALSVHMFVQDKDGCPVLDGGVHPIDQLRGARAAIIAALDPEDEALLMFVSDAIEDSTGGAPGSYSAAKAALIALRAAIDQQAHLSDKAIADE